MNFINTIRDSIYSPEFYQNVLKKTFGSALGYFALLSLLVSLLSTLFIVPSLLTFQNEIPQAINKIINSYPSDLEVKIKDGQVSTNVKEPYMVKIPEEDKLSSPANIIVIDTVTPFSATQFEKYNTAAWLTKDALVYKSDSQNQIRLYSLSNVQDFTLNKDFIEMTVKKFSPLLNFFLPAMIVIVIIGLFFLSLFRLVQLLLIAVLVWILGKIFKWNFSYGKAYIVSIYAITLPLLVELVVANTHKWTGISGFPFMFTVITLIVVFINFSTKPVKSSAKKK